ncbi:MAG: SMC family ATPase [Chloroflexi bacterium]|nr:SMC family ATPase [Chloroflexota bacterium]
MIPVKLAMRNFMCYRDNVPPLYFDGIHTACISGDNGNGKSALIDAMTWALWGRARARSDDDLIHAGEAETEVEFDFSAAGQIYRVIRKHSRPKTHRRSGQTMLDFQIKTAGGFKSIAGNSLTQTQQKVTEVLHMDYPTFINSALLLQGRADEFTVKRPAERKDVLADILGLSFYDRLEEQAREQARQQETEKVQLAISIEDIDRALAERPACETELQAALSGLAHLEKLTGEQESSLNRLRQEKAALENKGRQLAELERRLAGSRRGLERWEEQLEQLRSRLKEYEDLNAQRAAIEEGYARLAEARRLNDELERKLRQLTIMNERKHRLELAIVQASEALVREHALSQNRTGELEAKLDQLSRLKQEQQQWQAQWQRLAEAEETLRRKRQASQELKARAHHLESDNARLEREMGEIAEKLALLAAEPGATCPLCEAELGPEGRQHIENKYAADRQAKAHALKSNQADLAGKRSEAESLEKDISRLEATLSQDRDSLQSRASLLSQAIAEAEQARHQLAGERERVAMIEGRLARKDFAAAEQEALQEIEKELAKLNYDPQQHDQARSRLPEMEQFEASRRRLEQADRLISQEREAAARAEEAISELRHSLETDEQNKQGLALELVSLPQVTDALSQAEAEYQALAERRRQAEAAMWQAKTKLQHLSDMGTKRKEKASLLEEASGQERIYKDLAQAFGKNGIQALLIEMALPEIEEEANRLLARMTNGRMHVKMETQRESKKGDVIETLDINISDELGTRNYEMFSGGETFRINFAIRIALSRLLARRAGAPLPTLIIDEGFGTQDNAGIEKLKEAINSIQDDFDKILVITHIDELKDAFPVRIDVTKTAQGSTLQVSYL